MYNPSHIHTQNLTNTKFLSHTTLDLFILAYIMENVPQELVDLISSYLSYNDLKNTLLLSRAFQYSAEQHSGAFSDFTLNEDNANQFLEVYSGRHFRYLRNVRFRPSLPALEDKSYLKRKHCRETLDDLEQINQHFTCQINFLFSTLKTVETRADNWYGPGRIELTIYTPTKEVELGWNCLHQVFIGWRVRLLLPETLPSLACVRSLRIETGAINEHHEEPSLSIRKLDLRILFDISTKLPNLESLGCKLGSEEWPNNLGCEKAKYLVRDWEGPRRDSRHDFGKALHAAALPNLRSVNLDFLDPLFLAEDIDQRERMPNLTMPAKHDPFSSSLRLLSYQLRRMIVRVVADETLFWPTNGNVPTWPSLESLSVMFHMTSPSGTWYFRGLHNEGATEGFDVDENSYPPLTNEGQVGIEDIDRDIMWDGIRWDRCSSSKYRVIPMEDTLGPFLAGFARATASMPSLKEAALWSPLVFDAEDVDEFYEDFDHEDLARCSEDLAWGVAYTKPGTIAFRNDPGEDYSDVRQIWWKVANWRPESELHQLFQIIGRQEHGEGLNEYWGDDYYGQGLVQRRLFESFELRISG
jgi:hypothetical protein